MKRWFSWAGVGLLAALCAVVAVLQYRWIGEITTAERSRLQEQLGAELGALRTAFAEQIRHSAESLTTNAAEVQRLGREAAYARRYEEWKRSNPAIFGRIALVVPRNGALDLKMLDPSSGQFPAAAWPPEWTALRHRLEGHLTGLPGPPAGAGDGILEMPRFGSGPREGPREQEWLVLELNQRYLRTTLIPELVNRHLERSLRSDYDAAVWRGGDPEALIFESNPGAGRRIGSQPDAAVTLLASGPAERGMEARRDPTQPEGRGGRMARIMGGGLDWTLSLRHKAGSLEALVEQARRRNLALSAGLLLLIVATVGTLVQAARQSQRLAELQIHFVAGVSHELKTPLTVIRTAAYNLRGRMAERPGQVERYGQLIEQESKKLDTLISQVLQFTSAQAGHTIRQREPVRVEELIEKALESSAVARRQAGVVVEQLVEKGLPPVLADELAMRHALQNLIDNALKYGIRDDKWIGVYASAAPQGKDVSVEIRVADHGPGIPQDEQAQIFNPFFRGRRAVSDQVHGTGLGLDLVKKIVTAHGGTVQVKSAAGKRTEFVLRIPAA